MVLPVVGSNDITAFYLADIAGTVTGSDITVTLPIGTDVTALNKIVLSAIHLECTPVTGQLVLA